MRRGWCGSTATSTRTWPPTWWWWTAPTRWSATTARTGSAASRRGDTWCGCGTRCPARRTSRSISRPAASRTGARPWTARSTGGWPTRTSTGRTTRRPPRMPTATDPTPGKETPRPPGGSGPLRALVEEEPRGVGLRARLFLGSAALLIFTIGLAVAFLTRKAQSVAEAKILEDLKAVPAIYEGYRSSQASARERQLRSLALEAGTKALLAEVREHPETFHDSAVEFARSLGARTVFFFDADGLLIARSDREPGEEAGRDFTGIAWVDAPRERRSVASAFILEVTRERALSLVAAAPVTQGAGAEQRLNGVVAASFEMSTERARELALLTRAETAFLANVAPRGEPLQIEALAATPRLAPGGAASWLRPPPAPLVGLFQGGRQPEPFEFAAGGDSFIASAVPIRSGQGELIAALLVARSKQAEMAPFREIRRSLLAVGAAALLLSVPLSFLLDQGL